MRLRSNKLSFLVVGCCLMLLTGGLSASAQVNNSKGKTKFTKSDIEKLRWIEGSWRGSNGDGKLIFYENYHFVANGIVIKSYAQDSTFTKVKRQGRVYLLNGEIVHEGEGMLWSATKLNDSQIEFAPKKKATNSFIWQKESEDVWLARLVFKDEKGKPMEAVFRMERIEKQDELKQELLRLQHEINEAELKRDFVALDRLLTENYIFTESNGRISDRKQLYEDMKKSEPSTGETINYDEVKVYPYGDSAVMSYLLIVEVPGKDGMNNTYRFRGTTTWVKQQNRWRMAAIHVAFIKT